MCVDGGYGRRVYYINVYNIDSEISKKLNSFKSQCIIRNRYNIIFLVFVMKRKKNKKAKNI